MKPSIKQLEAMQLLITKCVIFVDWSIPPSYKSPAHSPIHVGLDNAHLSPSDVATNCLVCENVGESEHFRGAIFKDGDDGNRLRLAPES